MQTGIWDQITSETAHQPDARMRSFLHADSDFRAQRCLEELYQQHAEPIIIGIVRRRWRVSFNSAVGRETVEETEAHEARGEAAARVCARLRECRNTPGTAMIGDLASYVAVTAYRASDEVLRRKYPRRTALKNRVRYLLMNREGLALWNAGREWLCGLTSWHSNTRAKAPGPMLPNLPQGVCAELIEHLLECAGCPVPLERLVGQVADACGITDHIAEVRTDSEDEGTAGRGLPDLADTRVDVATEAAQRSYLARLWAEIRALPIRQRTVLLLNLRDDQGRGVIDLLPLMGIVSVRQISETLEISGEEMTALWEELPLDDQAIARRLSVTRQQVINLRKCARQRLARRMEHATADTM